jgi:hypothetical protein
VSITPLTKQIRDLLADGNWHSIREMVGLLGNQIRPEAAIRRYIHLRSRHASLNSQPTLENELWGRAQVIRDYLSGRGYETRGIGWDKEYKLPSTQRPRC